MNEPLPDGPSDAQNLEAAGPDPPPPEKIHRYRCAGCGANLLFEPRDGCLVCTHCGHKETIPASAEEITENSYEAYLEPRSENLRPLAGGAMQVSCDSCGALITFIPPETARACDFCGAKLVAQPRSADPLVAPEAVLPFSVSRQAAEETLRSWLSTRWFAPSALRQFSQSQGVSSIYLPFWTYDAHTVSYYRGERGEYYYITETYHETDSKGNRVHKTRRVRRIRWHPATGKVMRWFDDLLIPATRSLARERLDDLEPWDLGKLQPYDPAYLSGHKAQTYQVSLKEGFETARHIAAGVIDRDVRADIGGDEQRVEKISTHYSAITFKHLLLPVYSGAYRFKQRTFQIVINGRTGELQGDRPYSAWKIAFTVLAAAALALIIVWIIASSQRH